MRKHWLKVIEFIIRLLAWQLLYIAMTSLWITMTNCWLLFKRTSRSGNRKNLAEYSIENLMKLWKIWTYFEVMENVFNLYPYREKYRLFISATGEVLGSVYSYTGTHRCNRFRFQPMHVNTFSPDVAILFSSPRSCLTLAATLSFSSLLELSAQIVSSEYRRLPAYRWPCPSTRVTLKTSLKRSCRFRPHLSVGSYHTERHLEPSNH